MGYVQPLPDTLVIGKKETINLCTFYSSFYFFYSVKVLYKNHKALIIHVANFNFYWSAIHLRICQ